MSARFDVGCICAEKMSDDYIGPKAREGDLRNRAARRTRWLTRKWRRSVKGNSYINVEGCNLLVYSTSTKCWGFKIGARFSRLTYATADEAKLAMFDDFEGQT